MDPLIPFALTIAPEIACWLTGQTAEATTTAVFQSVQAVAGTNDAAAATAAVQGDPLLAAQLRVQLARIAADRDQAARTADMAALAATLSSAILSEVTAAPNKASAWSAAIMSAAVLLTFGIVMALVLVFGMRPGSETTSNMLLGTLAAMATSVVSYWVGSSAGSARKDDRLAQLSR